jgi:hypothetical protein
MPVAMPVGACLASSALVTFTNVFSVLIVGHICISSGDCITIRTVKLATYTRVNRRRESRLRLSTGDIYTVISRRILLH